MSLLTMRGWGCNFTFFDGFGFDLRFSFFISFFSFQCFSFRLLYSSFAFYLCLDFPPLLSPSACEPVFFLSLFLSFLYVYGSCALFPSSPFQT